MWKYVDGDGLWKRYKNTVTGEESIKEHEPRLIKQWCVEHEFSDKIPSNRMIECLKCGQEVKFIVGYHEMNDGKLSVRKASKQ